MGFSHLSSFVKNRRNNLFLVEKNKKRRKKINKYLIKKYKNFYLQSSIPKKKYFDFAIIATNPNERYLAIKNLLNNNKVKFLFLEKFLFNKHYEYRKVSKILNEKNIKTYVNVWSKIFLRRVKIHFYKKRNLKIYVEIAKNSILTNLIHFYSIFRELNGNKIHLNFDDLKLKKRNNYTDGYGKIVISGSNNNEMIIVAKTKRSNFFSINFKSHKNHRKIEYINGKLFNQKRKKSINFPLASEVTSLFFDKLMRINNKNNDLEYPNYKTVSFHSLKILKKLKKHYKKKISIR